MKRRGILLLILLGVLVLYFGTFRTSPKRLEDQYGTGEQSELLDQAIAYINTQPIYKSKYYEGGYPDDSYGTCVDVIGIALRNCGYDLRTEVNEDILAHPERYDIDSPDINIDFRRVKNLLVYFEHNETVLTTDIHDTEQWKAGDIVIFKNHIGMVSNHRNRHGIPYVIHHCSPFQMHYEEDILSSRTDLVMHIRITL